MAELGDFGFVEFLVDDAAGLVRVVTLVWTGLQGRGNYALSRASAEGGGPRTKSSLSTGQRSGTSRPSRPRRPGAADVADALRRAGRATSEPRASAWSSAA